MAKPRTYLVLQLRCIGRYRVRSIAPFRSGSASIPGERSRRPSTEMKRPTSNQQRTHELRQLLRTRTQADAKTQSRRTLRPWHRQRSAGVRRSAEDRQYAAAGEHPSARGGRFDGESTESNRGYDDRQNESG